MFKKISSGIILCRTNSHNIPEILMVKKRLSYNFCIFVSGKFKYKVSHLLKLFNRMTVSEKLLIKHNEFDAMWKHIWTSIPDPINHSLFSYYSTCKKRYVKLMSIFTHEKLCSLINQSFSDDLFWDIPKGRVELKESLEEGAMRELYEETGISPEEYKLISIVPKITYSYTISNNVFIIKHFIASIDNPNRKINFRMNNPKQYSEISAIKWMSLENLRYVKLSNKNLKTHIKNALKMYKSYKKMNTIDT
jgi:ADP-ribose pyrophosphatase YjhB (NUDIX family)